MEAPGSHGRALELLQELQQAQEKQAALKQQRTQMIHAVATSPKKQIARKQRIEENKRASRPPPRPKGSGAGRATIPAYHPEGAEIAAPRPASPSPSQDTVGREIDAAIAKSVANMLQTPEAVKGPRIVPIPAAGAADASPMSPSFFTKKKRNMHCELDEPGAGVPYPRAYSGARRGGFWGRLFSCFAPPSPYRLSPDTAPLARPTSAKVVSYQCLLGEELFGGS